MIYSSMIENNNVKVCVCVCVCVCVYTFNNRTRMSITGWAKSQEQNMIII